MKRMHEALCLHFIFQTYAKPAAPRPPSRNRPRLQVDQPLHRAPILRLRCCDDA